MRLSSTKNGVTFEKRASFILQTELTSDRLDVRGEERDCRDDCRSDGEALGHGLGGVAHCVEADHDLAWLTLELSGHFRDARGVVGDWTEGVLGDDDTGGGEHSHAAQRDEVERELDVAAAHPQRCTERDGDAHDGIHRGLEACRGSRQHDGCRTGLCRLGDFFDRAVFGSREVLGQAAEHLGEDETDDDGTEDAPADSRHRDDRTVVACITLRRVADVIQRECERADHGDDSCGEEAAVDWLQRVRLAVLRAHGEDAGDRGEHADGASGQGEHETECRVQTDRGERSDAQDDRGDERYFVAFEEVGGHACAVTDVVAHVVGDRRGVARVVFWDSRLDLADQVGADVSGLGEDAATDAQEEREERSTEAEADEHRR